MSAQGLQRYNSPAGWARKLFKPSTDSASHLLEIEKKNFFVLRLGFSGGDVTSGGVISVFWAYFTRPWMPIQWANFFAQVFVETRLSSESLEPLIGFLAYLEPKLCHKTQKVVKISTPTKEIWVE